MPVSLRRSIAVLAALVAFAALAATRAAVARGYSATVSVGRAAVTRPIPSAFLGLALEYNTIPQWASSANPVFGQLLRNLDPIGRPLLRIGGQSTDRTWWPVRGIRRPLGVTYDLTPRWATLARNLAQATNAQLMLGVNLEADRPAIAGTEAAQLVRRIGRTRVDSLQIGNEPNLYRFTPWYRVLGGHPVPWYSHTGTKVYSRAPGYGPSQFTQEFGQTLRVMPGVPIAGPETGTGAWLQAFHRFLSPRSRVRMLTWHAYGLSQCDTDPSTPGYPTVPNLLTETASRSLLDGVGSDIGLAHRDGATFRIDEMGSVTCNGRAGVSDTMASALWAVDALFATARAGVDGVNLHTYPGSDNGLFDLTRSHGRWQGSVQPIYYGALMFAQAAPAGSRLLRIGATGPDQLRAWATLGADRQVRVVVINDDLHAGARAVVRAPVGFGAHPAAIERLRGPSAYARGGVTLGGRRFGPVTTTGALRAAVPQTVADRGGRYTVALPPASAALLTLAPG